MPENSANEANMTELRRHIKRIGNRLENLDRGSVAYEQGIADVEDYYERIIQLRQYTINDLSEDVLQIEGKYTALKRSLCMAVTVLLLLLGGSTGIYWTIAAH